MSELTIEEQESILRSKATRNNAFVLSNIIELVTSVIVRVAGHDTADEIDGETLNRNIVSNLVARDIKEKLSK